MWRHLQLIPPFGTLARADPMRAAELKLRLMKRPSFRVTSHEPFSQPLRQEAFSWLRWEGVDESSTRNDGGHVEQINVVGASLTGLTKPLNRQACGLLRKWEGNSDLDWSRSLLGFRPGTWLSIITWCVFSEDRSRRHSCENVYQQQLCSKLWKRILTCRDLFFRVHVLVCALMTM